MTADDKARLDALTPERLRELGGFYQKILVGQRELAASPYTADGLRAMIEIAVVRNEQIVALCEAVAAAECAIRTVGVTGEVLTIAGIGDRGVATNVHRDLWEGACLCEDQYETLAAALGAVSEKDT